LNEAATENIVATAIACGCNRQLGGMTRRCTSYSKLLLYNGNASSNLVPQTACFLSLHFISFHSSSCTCSTSKYSRTHLNEHLAIRIVHSRPLTNHLGSWNSHRYLLLNKPQLKPVAIVGLVQNLLPRPISAQFVCPWPELTTWLLPKLLELCISLVETHHIGWIVFPQARILSAGLNG